MSISNCCNFSFSKVMKKVRLRVFKDWSWVEGNLKLVFSLFVFLAWRKKVKYPLEHIPRLAVLFFFLWTRFNFSIKIYGKDIVDKLKAHFCVCLCSNFRSSYQEPPNACWSVLFNRLSPKAHSLQSWPLNHLSNQS